MAIVCISLDPLDPVRHEFVKVCGSQLYFIDRFDSISLSLLAGHSLLCPAMALEVLGRRQNTRPHDGLRHWHLLGHGKEAEEEAPNRLLVG